MNHFKKSNGLRDRYLTELQIMVRKEISTELKRITKGLHGRKIIFDDGMGSITINIECKRGGHYTIAEWDQYHSEHKNFYSMHMRRLPVIQELLTLLSEYEEFYGDVSAGTIEFKHN